MKRPCCENCKYLIKAKLCMIQVFRNYGNRDSILVNLAGYCDLWEANYEIPVHLWDEKIVKINISTAPWHWYIEEEETIKGFDKDYPIVNALRRARAYQCPECDETILMFTTRSQCSFCSCPKCHASIVWTCNEIENEIEKSQQQKDKE